MRLTSLKTKFFLAIVTLLAGLVAIGSSTYAWFAHNGRATADNMNVTVKCDGSFMLIKEGHVLTAAELQTDNANVASAIKSSAALLPAAHEDVEDMDDADTPGNWYFKKSKDPDVYGGDGLEYSQTALTAGNMDDYVLVNEFSISIADGGNDMTQIKVSSCSISTTGDTGVSVLVATEDAAEEFSGTGGYGQVALADRLTDQDVIYFKVYIYWDGKNENVKSNNLSHLLNTNVEVVLTGLVDSD